MQYRPLGRTGLSVSAICLGTMTWGRQNTEAEGHAQIDAAIEAGVTFIDTAEMYPIPPDPAYQGQTESIIGNWLAAHGGRDRLVIASKVYGRSDRGWMRPGTSGPRLDRANIEAAIDGTLRRLRTDYVDLYQLHWPDRDVPMFGSHGTTYQPPAQTDETPIEQTLEVLADLVRAGKVRHVGLSNETAWGTMRFLAAALAGQGPRMASIQNAYSLLNRTFEMGLAEIAMREQVGLLAYSPLGQGTLTGKYLNAARPPGARMTLFGRGERYQKPGTEEAIAAYVALAHEIDVEPAALALAFVTSRCFVTSNVIGATSLEQLSANLHSTKVIITPEIEARIDAIHQRMSNPAP